MNFNKEKFKCPNCEGIGYKEKNGSNVILKDDFSKCKKCKGKGVIDNCIKLDLSEKIQIGDYIEYYDHSNFCQLVTHKCIDIGHDEIYDIFFVIVELEGGILQRFLGIREIQNVYRL